MSVEVLASRFGYFILRGESGDQVLQDGVHVNTRRVYLFIFRN
jgi:hypothetical protein